MYGSLVQFETLALYCNNGHIIRVNNKQYINIYKVLTSRDYFELYLKVTIIFININVYDKLRIFRCF